MSLIIGRFATRCRAPRRLNIDAATVDRIARAPFVAECARQLDGIRSTGLCRVRRLTVKLTVAASDLNEGRLPQLWASAFARALREALAGPSGPGIVRAAGRAEWLARWLADLTAGLAEGRWEFDEFAPLRELGTADAALAALLDDPREGEIVSVLGALDELGALDRLFSLLDDLALERLVAEASSVATVEDGPSRISDLQAVAIVLGSGRVPVSRGRIADRRVAFRVLIELRLRFPAGPAIGSITPRRALHALAALAELLALGGASDGLDAALTRRHRREGMSTGGPIHPAVAAILDELQSLPRSGAGSSGGLLDALNGLVETLGPLVPSPVIGEAQEIASDVAGLFLLAGSIERLGWPSTWITGPLAHRHGSRALDFSLAALALTVLGRRVAGVERLDPAIAVFAGFEGEPDLGGLRRFVEAELTGGETLAALDAMAELLIRTFAAQVRGFREASRAFIVAKLIATPGAIFVEERRLLVRLATNPYHAALRVSGMDYPAGPLAWLGGRVVEYELEGL